MVVLERAGFETGILTHVIVDRFLSVVSLSLRLVSSLGAKKIRWISHAGGMLLKATLRSIPFFFQYAFAIIGIRSPSP